mgnify:CR=1 FL=1
MDALERFPGGSSPIAMWCLPALFLAGAACGEGFRYPVTDWKDLGLVGPVRHATECSYTVVKGKRSECVPMRDWLFDEAGMLLRRDSRHEPSDRMERRIYFYDPDHRQIRIQIGGSTYYVMRFDSSGRYEEQQLLMDPQGRDVRYAFRRDSSGRKLSMTGFHRTPSGDSVFLEEHFTYDTRGNRIRSTSKSIDAGSFEEIRSYRYDSRGRILEERLEVRSFHTSRYTTSYRYDRRGWLVRQTQVGSGWVVRTDFTYDTRGNWVREEVAIDDRPTNFTERTFEYFQGGESRPGGSDPQPGGP